MKNGYSKNLEREYNTGAYITGEPPPPPKKKQKKTKEKKGTLNSSF